MRQTTRNRQTWRSKNFTSSVISQLISILQMIKTKFQGVKAYYLLIIKVVKCVFWIYIFDKFFIVKKESFCPSIPLAPKFENVWHWGEQRLCCAQTLKVRRINVVKNGNGWWGRKVENRLNTYVFGRVHVLVFTSTCTCTFIHNSLRFMYSSWTSPFSCILLSDKKIRVNSLLTYAIIAMINA